MMSSLYDSKSRPQQHAITDGSDDNYWGREAFAEAERVLAEAGGDRFHYVSLDALHMGFLAGDADSLDLASALAAIMPVLDEMAEEAYDRVAYAPEHWTCGMDGMADRNRATLAGMEAR